MTLLNYGCFVSFSDNNPPTFPDGCTDNLEVFASRLGQPTIVNWSPPAVSDNSGKAVTLQSSIPPGSIFSLGVTTVTYTATDIGGNTRSCRFTVTVTSKLQSRAVYCVISENSSHQKEQNNNNKYLSILFINRPLSIL